MERTSRHSQSPILDFLLLAPNNNEDSKTRWGYSTMITIYQTLTLTRQSESRLILECASQMLWSVSRKAPSRIHMLRCRPKLRNSIICSLRFRAKTPNLTRCSTTLTSERSSLRRLWPLQRTGVSLQRRSTDTPFEVPSMNFYTNCTVVSTVVFNPFFQKEIWRTWLCDNLIAKIKSLYIKTAKPCLV